jgi:hypothetical protein
LTVLLAVLATVAGCALVGLAIWSRSLDQQIAAHDDLISDLEDEARELTAQLARHEERILAQAERVKALRVLLSRPTPVDADSPRQVYTDPYPSASPTYDWTDDAIPEPAIPADVLREMQVDPSVPPDLRPPTPGFR